MTAYAAALARIVPDWRQRFDAAGGRWKPNQPDGTYTPPPIATLERIAGAAAEFQAGREATYTIRKIRERWANP